MDWHAIIRGRASSLPISHSLTAIHPAWLCLAAALGLSLLGVSAINLATTPAGDAMAGLSALAWKQVVFLLVGLLAAVMVSLPHYRLIGALAHVLAAGSIALLILLLVPGVPESIVSPINGARAWIRLPGFNVQPSELTKIAFVLVLAGVLRRRPDLSRLRNLLPPALLTMVPVGLILLQPDLGTASLFLPSLAAVLLINGMRLRHLALALLAGALLAPASWPFLQDYQRERVLALVQQVRGDRTGENDANFQSFTAQRLIGAGGVIGMPPQRAHALVQYNRLPEAHNDMVYAVIVARHGMLGGLAVLALHALWLSGAALAAAWTKDPFGRTLCVGLAAFIATQAIINIGMNIGLLPIVGITLPFVSYGGSSLITCWIMTGLIFNVAMRRPVAPIRPSLEYADEDVPFRRRAAATA